MSPSSSAEESASTTGLPALRKPSKEALETNSTAPVTQIVPLVRKSKRPETDSPETSTSQSKTARAEYKSSPTPLRRSERGNSQSPLKFNTKSSMSDAKVRSQRVNDGNSEDVGAKRKKLDARRFKSLFRQNKNNCVSTEAEDKHQSVSNQSENKLRKKFEIFASDPDLWDRITRECQTKEVFNVVKEKPGEHKVDHDFPVSRCKSNPVEHDSSAGIESEIPSVGILTVSGKDRPIECQTGAHACVQEDRPLSLSHDNRGSTQNVESYNVEVSDGTCVKSKNEAVTLKENSLHGDIAVDDEETIHSGERDVDVVNQISPISDQSKASCSGSANVSRSRNEVKASSKRSASAPQSRRFVEYWVPARLSNLQLEQYCAALLANSVSLCSSLKSDPVGAIHNLLITLRKVCNHPFLVDPDLSSSLLENVKETEYLDVGIKASGKLQLLETLLLEMKKRGWRVLILYESSIYARDTIGEILDDFLLQRYGRDSFEHVDGGATNPSKKQAALNRFNDKESGRFLFLLEIRACAPSIKMSSLDSIIIFNSDWNPDKDIGALRKIDIDSQHDPINIIRLFLPLTLEENAKFLSKHNVSVDKSMHNISHSHRDKLLIRGASDLFHELERFHRVSDHVSCMISSFESSLLQDVAQELMSVYLDGGRKMGDGHSIYLKVQRRGEGHGKIRLVVEESDTLLKEENWPCDFWSKLLKSRNPQWKFVSDPNKRKRKKVHYAETEDVKRSRKVVHDSNDVTSTVDDQKVVTSAKGSLYAKDNSQVIPEVVCIPLELHNTALESGTMLEESSKLHDTKKSLHLLLKPELQKLCELLNLSEDVKKVAERFLEFVVENHHVTTETVTLLQAFHMSVCWIAASLRKQKISCQESLTLARKHLNFCCSTEATDYMYLKLVLFKELFIQSTVDVTANDHAYDTVFPVTDSSEDYGVELKLATSDSKSPIFFDAEKLMVKIIKHINKKCRERMKVLIESQHKELEELHKSTEEEKQRLERVYKVEAAVVRTIHAHNLSMAAEKLKALEDQHSKTLEEHRNNISSRSKSLEHKHASEKNKENELASSWKEDIVKEQVEILQKLTHYNMDDGKRKCNSNEQLLDSQKECRALEDPEVLKSQPGALADGVEGCQSATPDEALALPPASCEAGNFFSFVGSAISASAKVLPENSASISSESGQLACGEAAKFVNLTSDMEMPESSPVDVLPLKPNTSALMDGPSPEKTLDCQTTLQQLSESAVLIPGCGLLSPSIDVPLTISNGNGICVGHDSEALSVGHSVPLPASPAVLDNEVGHSSLVSSLEGDNCLPTSPPNFEVQAAKGHSEMPLLSFTSGFEQSDSHNKVGQSVLHTTTDYANVDPTAKAAHQLPETENLLELPPFTITTGSTQSQPDSQLLHTATGLSIVNPTAAESEAEPPVIKGLLQSQSSSGTPRTEKSDSDLQLELLRRAATDLLNVEPSTAEAVHQLPATEGHHELPNSISTPRCEQDHYDIQLDESLRHIANHTYVESSAPEAVHQSPATERQVGSHSEQSHSNIDHSLLNTTNGHFGSSAGEAVQLLPATETIIALRLEQSHSDIENGPPLPQIATDHCSTDQFPAEAVHRLSATEEQLELPSTDAIPRSGQSDSDNQLDNFVCQPATNHSNMEPPAGEAASAHSPLVDSSPSQPQSSVPVSEELPGRGVGTTLNTDAPNPYPSPYAVGVPCVSPVIIAITQPMSSGPRATNAMSDFPTNLIPGTTVASTESVRISSFSYLDPLQTELIRVQKEADHSVKEYEEMKQLLNSECEKEIENIRAQIRKKYETKIVELDAARKYKKHELDVYRSKVYMNRMLAEIFRNKCSDPKVFVPPGILQDNVQHQLRRQPPESAPQPPVILNTSQAVQSMGNSQGTQSSLPLRHPELGSVSSAGPIYRRGTQSPFGPGGPSAAALQNFVRAGGPSSSSLQNSVRPGSPSAAVLQNFAHAGGPSSTSLQNSVRPGSPSALASPNNSRPAVPATPVSSSPNPICPGVTTRILPGTPLPRSAALSPSGLPSTNPFVSRLPRPVGTPLIVQQATPRTVQVGNHPAGLFSGYSARPVSTTSTATPTVNLHSVSGIRAPAPHLRSRISQPVAPSTTISPRIPNSSPHPTYSNVSLPAPSAVNQYSSYHGAASAASDTPSDIQNGVLTGTDANVSHFQVVERSNVPPPQTNNGGIHNLPSTTGSTNPNVVCLSDSE